MSRELIKNLKSLKSKDGRLNPDHAWVARNREELVDCIKQQADSLRQKTDEKTTILQTLSEGLHVFVSGRILHFAKSSMAVLLVGILAVGGWITGVSASSSSLPGEVLYGVKIAAEKTELIVASVIGSKEEEVTTILKHASTRVDEYQRSESTEQATEAIKSLKKKIESTQESLNDVSQSSSETAVAVAKVVEKRTEEILDSLADTNKTQEDQSSMSDEKKEISQTQLKKEVVEAEALIVKAGITAVEVLVESVETGGVSEDIISKAEVKDTINRRLDKLVSDVSKLDLTVGETRQYASSTIAIMTATSTAISSNLVMNTSTLNIENIASSTENIIVKVEEAAQKVVEAGKKAEETKTDVKNFIDQNNLTAALDKIKELDGIKVETKAVMAEASVAVETAEKAVAQEAKTGETVPSAQSTSSTSGVMGAIASTTVSTEVKLAPNVTATIKTN